MAETTTSYAKITSLPELADKVNLNNSDLFLICRQTDVATGNYDSYKCSFKNIQESVADKVLDLKLDIKVKPSLSDCTLTDTTNAASSKCVVELLNKINSSDRTSSSSYLSKTSTDEQSISGKVVFGEVPRCSKEATDDNDLITKKQVKSMVGDGGVFMEGSTTSGESITVSRKSKLLGVVHQVSSNCMLKIDVKNLNSFYGVYSFCTTCASVPDGGFTKSNVLNKDLKAAWIPFAFQNPATLYGVQMFPAKKGSFVGVFQIKNFAKGVDTWNDFINYDCTIIFSEYK